MKKIFLIAVLILAGAATQGKERTALFFQEWKIEKSTSLPNGAFQVLYRNPDQTVAIKAVVVTVIPDGTVLAYWYFDPEPKVFLLENNQYILKAEVAKKCLGCHAKQRNL